MDLTTNTTAAAGKTSLTTTGPAAGAPAATIGSDYQMFLKLLTAQMKNQDPLNPIDSTDYATQLATFSGVEQQVKTNTLLSALTSQLGVAGMGQYTSWVGMEARTDAPVPYDGRPVTLYPVPDPSADTAYLVAYDGAGRAVSRLQIPTTGAPVTWDGTGLGGGALMGGIYRFRVENLAGGQPLADGSVESYGTIREVVNGADGVQLLLQSGQTILPADVRALRPAGATQTGQSVSGV